MSTLLLAITAMASALALVSLGGGLYEYRVVDPAWPRRPDLIQPDRGGVSRRRFWIPAHVAFELALVLTLIIAWSRPEVRAWLLVGLASHAIMRIWSAFDFIPKALAFERAETGTITEDAARRWARRSLWRLPLDAVTCVAIAGGLCSGGPACVTGRSTSTDRPPYSDPGCAGVTRAA